MKNLTSSDREPGMRSAKDPLTLCNPITIHALESLLMVGEKIEFIAGYKEGMSEEMKRDWVASIKRYGQTAARHLGVPFEDID